MTGIVSEAHAVWPPAAGADPKDRQNWPNDPDYACQWQLFSFLPQQVDDFVEFFLQGIDIV